MIFQLRTEPFDFSALTPSFDDKPLKSSKIPFDFLIFNKN